MKVIILAGGQGKRLFPLSKESKPKQFIKLQGKSLFQRTLERHKDFPIYIVLKKNYINMAKEQAKEINVDADFIEEPVPKNTFPAIVWSIHRMRDIKDDDIIAVIPSDHYIEPKDIYLQDLQIAEEIAREGYIVIFGIKPNRPDTGFGYIRIGYKKNSAFKVERFIEKPSLEKAEEFVKSRKYMWNSGIFVFSVKTFKEECEKYQRYAYDLLEAKDENIAMELFTLLEETPMDKAIIEKSKRVMCLPFRAKWSDVGTFKGIYEIFCDDSRRVVLKGDILEIDSKDILIFSEDKPVVTIGLKNIAIVNTKDCILVLNMDHSQKVKHILEFFKDV